MLGQIFDTLTNLFNLIKDLGQFAIDLMGDLLELIQMLLSVARTSPQWLNFMPDFARVAFCSILAAVIVMRIAGRE